MKKIVEEIISYTCFGWLQIGEIIKYPKSELSDEELNIVLTETCDRYLCYNDIDNYDYIVIERIK